MSDAISICSQAFLAIGADPIKTFGDSTTEADLANARYKPIKQALLRGYPWNCAIRRVALKQADNPPLEGQEFSNQFELPEKCLRVLDVWVGGIRPQAAAVGRQAYSIEGRKLLANESALSISYIHDIPEAEFDAHVEEALVSKLSAEFSYTLHGSPSTSQQFLQLAAFKLDEARITDALENPHTTLRIDTLERVRH